MAQTPDASCVSVTRWYYQQLAPWMNAFLAKAGEVIAEGGSATLLGAFWTSYGSRPSLRVERQVAGVGVYAYEWVYIVLFSAGGGYPANMPLEYIQKGFGQSLLCVMRNPSHVCGQPDSYLAQWSTWIAPILRAMLPAIGYNVTLTATSEQEARLPFGALAVRQQALVLQDRGMMIPMVSVGWSIGPVVSGNATIDYGDTAQPTAPAIVLGALQGMSELTEAIRGIAQQDVDVALNSGGIIYSVRSKELTEE